MSVAVVLLMMIRIDWTVTNIPTMHATAQVVASTSAPVSVSPQGWRRTANGWEHSSQWRALSLSLNDLILAQQQREPAWVQGALQRVRSLPPLVFCAMQLAMVALIVWVSETKKGDQKSLVAKSPAGENVCRA